MNRKIIIALIIIVLIVLGCLIAFSSNSKIDTQINFLSAGNLQNGAQIQFELKDAQGNALANQNINIEFGSNDKKQNFTITTDSQGRGALVLNDENPGNYSISVSYAGDDKHNGCSATKNITIGDETSENVDTSYTYNNSTQSTSYSSSSSSDLNYDSELNEHYDSSGKIVGGQNDGADYDYIKNNPPNVVNGSLE